MTGAFISSVLFRNWRGAYFWLKASRRNLVLLFWYLGGLEISLLQFHNPWHDSPVLVSAKCRNRGRKCMFWLHQNVPYQTVCRGSGLCGRCLCLPAGQHVHWASSLSAEAVCCPLTMGRSTVLNGSVILFSLVKIREQRACKLCPEAGHSLHRNDRPVATRDLWMRSEHYVRATTGHRWPSCAGERLHPKRLVFHLGPPANDGNGSQLLSTLLEWLVSTWDRNCCHPHFSGRLNKLRRLQEGAVTASGFEPRRSGWSTQASSTFLLYFSSRVSRVLRCCMFRGFHTLGDCHMSTVLHLCSLSER